MDANLPLIPKVEPVLGMREFVGLAAALMAVHALAIDAMLPAHGQISNGIGIAPGNQQQWIVTSYLLGLGVGQLIYGPLADRFGRRRVLLATLAVFSLCSLAAAACRSFELMMIARVLQGASGAGGRVLAITIVRDHYAGRAMARVMSLVSLVFLGVPVFAPSLGQLILLVAPWPFIFIALAAVGGVILLWVAIRLPETLHKEDRRSIGLTSVAAAFRLSLGNRVSLGYTLALTLLMGALFGFINSAQQVIAVVFRQPQLFALFFAMIGASLAVAALLNSRLVGRLGMRFISHAALLGFIAVSVIHSGIALSGYETLPAFAILQSCTMFCFGLMGGNFNAMSMEPLGHIAGTAASAQGFTTTIGGALIGFAIGQHFAGSVTPLILGFALCGVAALGVVLTTEKFRLFHARPATI